MIPFIRSLSELMALTEFRDSSRELDKEDEYYSSTMDSGQRKRYIKSLEEKEVELPNLPKILRRNWISNKKLVYSLLDNLDYNNQIQSSYDLTLLDRQNNRNQEDAA